MKKMKLFCGILIGFMILSSCSNDDNSNDNNDIIIGEWQAIQQFQSDVSVDLSPTLECIYSTFTVDNRFFSDLISSDDLPVECNSLDFEFGLTWTNIGNNQYRIGFEGEQSQINIFYKDGSNLVQERPDGVTKIIYEPYEQ